MTLSPERIAQQTQATRAESMAPQGLPEMIDAEIRQLRFAAAAAKSTSSILDVLTSTSSDEEAIEGIASALGCDQATAEYVYYSPLRELHPQNVANLEDRIHELTAERDGV
jgi:hypothetical protein